MSVAAARGGAAAGLVLALFELGEVGRGREQALERGAGVFAIGLKRAGKERQSRAEQDRAGKTRAARPARRCSLRRLCSRNRGTWNGVSALVLRQKPMVVRAPTTVASSTTVDVAAGLPDVLEVRLHRPAGD